MSNITEETRCTFENREHNFKQTDEDEEEICYHYGRLSKEETSFDNSKSNFLFPYELPLSDIVSVRVMLNPSKLNGENPNLDHGQYVIDCLCVFYFKDKDGKFVSDRIVRPMDLKIKRTAKYKLEDKGLLQRGNIPSDIVGFDLKEKDKYLNIEMKRLHEYHYKEALENRFKSCKLFTEDIYILAPVHQLWPKEEDLRWALKYVKDRFETHKAMYFTSVKRVQMYIEQYNLVPFESDKRLKDYIYHMPLNGQIFDKECNCYRPLYQKIITDFTVFPEQKSLPERFKNGIQPKVR